MSSANLDTVMRGIDAFNRHDVDVLVDQTTPDFAWFPALPGTFQTDGYHGREGLETYFGEIEDTWEELHLLVDEFREQDDTALVLGRANGRGRASGIEVDAPIGIVYRFEGAKVRYCRAYLDPGEAVREAGLSSR